METDTNADGGSLYFVDDFSINTYNMLTLQLIDNEWYVYLNNVLQDSVVVINEALTISTFGNSRNKTDFLDGNLDEIRIYDRALTANEVEALNDVPLLLSSYEGYDIYASYNYIGQSTVIDSNILKIGFPLIGIIILLLVVLNERL